METTRTEFFVDRYDLAATLTSGQVFRWTQHAGGWESVVGRRFVRLCANPHSIVAETVGPMPDWTWLAEYLQVHLDYRVVIEAMPRDPLLQRAITCYDGLRLLRQDPWECLASFILSSTKRISQITRIIEKLCQQYGDPVACLLPGVSARAFPSAVRLAGCSEAELRACGMGFRAPYLLQTARFIAGGQLNLKQLQAANLENARRQLLALPGVGRKIADCVLLFSFGFSQVFPLDVWMQRVLRIGYFQGKTMPARRLLAFAQQYFGPFAGYAQQFLFHDARMQALPALTSPVAIQIRKSTSSRHATANKK